MKWFEMLKQKLTPRVTDAPQSKKVSDDALPGNISPKILTSEPSERLALLTLREREFFLLLLEGYTLKESAKRLNVKYSTANTHMTGIYKKLGVHSRAELIIQYRDTVERSI